MQPLVSAITPAYNAERFLSAALDSALAQTLREFEVIVVDDGSTDSTAAIAARYAAAHPQHIRVVQQSNEGLCAARNAAMQLARGKYFALLDADDVWLPQHLAASVHALESEPAVGLVHANIERIDAQGNALHVPPRYWREHDDAFARLFLRDEHVSCPTTVFRRELIDRLGGFDMRFNRLGCEDRDLWLRIAAVCGLRFLPDVHARYRQHGANMSSNVRKMQCARLLLVDKFSETPQGRPLRRAALAAVHVGIGDELLNAGRRFSAFGAYAQALTRQPSLRSCKALLRCLLRPLPDAAGSHA
jgi:glycosyltransferase involved in cell wall biosynthesis